MTLRGLFLVFAFVFALAPGRAWAQSDPVIEIHGVVTEVGLGLGLEGAEVTIYEFAGADRVRTVYATAVTDPHGEFRFHPVRFGDYWVEVKKQAYFATIPMEGVSSLIGAKPPTAEMGTLVTVSAAHPSQEVRFALMRPGELTGTVMDENDKPLPGMLVEITMAGLPSLAKATSRTGPDGAFAIKMLMPGEYIIKVSAPKSWIALLPKFTEDDVKIVDQSLETVYWPGVPEAASATPVRVSPGAPASLGTIHIGKTPSYRARVSMKGCEPDDLPNFTIVAPNERVVVQNGSGPLPVPLMPFSSVSSCEDVLVTGLKPGSYSFHLTSKRGWAATPIGVASKNLEVSLTLLPSVDISGRIVAGDGAMLPPLDKVRIRLQPEDAARPTPPSSPDAKGGFVAKGLQGPSHRVRIEGLGDNYYVKEIRLDGRSVPDGVLHLYQGSQIEIVLDDQPAAITGAVTDADKPFSQPLVYLAKWPSLEVIDRKVTGDNDGQFQIAGLEPGEYRVLAVQSAALPDGQQISAQMLSRLWSSAEKVTVERGGSQSLALKLSDPLR